MESRKRFGGKGLRVRPRAWRTRPLLGQDGLNMSWHPSASQSARCVVRDCDPWAALCHAAEPARSDFTDRRVMSGVFAEAHPRQRCGPRIRRLT